MEEKETRVLLFNTEETVQKFILVAVEEENAEIPAEQSLDELSELLATAGGEEAASLIQRRESPHPKTYLGSGKIDEVKAALELTHADGVITDD